MGLWLLLYCVISLKLNKMEGRSKAFIKLDKLMHTSKGPKIFPDILSRDWSRDFICYNRNMVIVLYL